ncbi:hypothetical protein C2G38_1005953 [Gigaspora rosea]|uniref:Uncharacterized protein n=1 Tax=Gigaspora rosea TaxID=44941 RepID=A0A397VIN4_9GLOM|nr:hypothetical protein C2G38_1005953 [Gigaspora rosea]
MKHRNLTAILISLAVTDYEYLTILKDVPMFTKEYEQINIFNVFNMFNMFKHIFGIAIMWGAFFDIFFRNIPQIIIQVYYYRYVRYAWIYEIVPLLLLVTSCLKIFTTIFNYVCKKRMLNFIRYVLYNIHA